MELYKEESGRRLNNYSEIYQLPADEEEFERLNRQHVMLQNILGYKYVPGMSEVMTHVPGQRRRSCVDLGCGSGSWIVDVAKDFPRCNAVAIDLIPLQESIMPRNLRSEVDDINIGLDHYRDSFDVAHTRLIAAGIRDYHRLIDQLARVVLPGGLIDLTEYDFRAYNHLGKVIEVDLSVYKEPWWARWLCHLRDAIKERGGDIHASEEMFSWVKANPAYENVVYMEHYLGVVPHPRTGPNAEALRQIDRAMADNVLSFVGAGRPLLRGYGFPDVYLNDLEARVSDEVRNQRYFQYTRLQSVYARRRL